MEGQMMAGGFILCGWRMYAACLDVTSLHLNDDTIFITLHLNAD